MPVGTTPTELRAAIDMVAHRIASLKPRLLVYASHEWEKKEIALAEARLVVLREWLTVLEGDATKYCECPDCLPDGTNCVRCDRPVKFT